MHSIFAVPARLWRVMERGRHIVILRETSGAQLLEIALTLPFLLVLIVGVADFGGAFTLRQNLNNACREGSRFASAESSLDLDCGSSCGSSIPDSVMAVRDVVANYLMQVGLTSCTIGTSASYSAADESWTFASNSTGCSGFSLLIARGYTFPNSEGARVLATRVSLTFPYSWTFNKTIQLLPGGEGLSLPATISSDAVMENLS